MDVTTSADMFIRNLFSLAREIVRVENGQIVTGHGRRSQTRHTASTSAMNRVQRYHNPFKELGDITYAGSDGQLLKLPIGPEGYILMVVDGLPAWVSP